MSEVKYLDASRIIAARKGVAPAFGSTFGYGRKIPTGWELLLDDGRRRRVYMAQGTPCVLIKKEWYIIGPAAEQRIEELNGLPFSMPSKP